MHAFARRFHKKSSEASSHQTKGLILNSGWSYDLGTWSLDTFLFRGQLRKMRQKTINLARLQPGGQVLDVGCGTGTLVLEAQKQVGATGHAFGIDPGAPQIAHARTKAAWHHVPIDFQLGVIEHLPFPDQAFDVVFSTLMMHHLPAPLKRQGLAEIARVLKPAGCLVLADFTHKADRTGQATHLHAGGSRVQDLVALLTEAGFTVVETEEVQPSRFSTFPGASIMRADKQK